MFLELLTPEAWTKYLHCETEKGYAELNLDNAAELVKKYSKEVSSQEDK